LTQIALAAAVLLLLLIPISTPTLALLLMPLIIWMALRSSYTQMMGVTAAFSMVSTLYIVGEHGVFSNIGFGKPIPTTDMLVLSNTFVLVILSGAIPLSAIVAVLRRTTQQATDEKKRLQRVVESATGIMIVTMDQEGRVTRFSPGATRILGFGLQEVQRGEANLIPLEQRAEIMARHGLTVHNNYADVVRKLLEKNPNEPITSVTPMVHRDGTTRVLATTTTPIRGGNGEILEFLTTADDVTERVSTENALRKALKTEQHASERLAHVDQLKTELVSTVSHELRTPIASIIGYTEVLLDKVPGELNPDQRRMLDSIERSSRRLMRLVDDLLTVSHIEDTTISLNLTNFSLTSLIDAVIDGIMPIYQRAEVTLQVAPFDEELRLDADFNHVFRMISNLLSNAAKFSHQGERVNLSISTQNDDLMIRVSDTGIGIPREDQEQLFSRFFRAHNAYENQIPGTGLGLYITSRIAQQHGGEVSVESKLGQGTTFTVRLPMHHHGEIPASAIRS
ncbi:MAG TPA: PAS domain-containing sensor histidine kinase, partial [Marmoricola sp.]|nr:PAS domain-containing sensor histidine kinase [Marmoricola sp.]